jgi:NADH-quinone oxidoreductase subunit A
MLIEFGKIFLFLIIGAVIVGASFIVQWLLRPRRGYEQKNSTYECGEEPTGSPWIRLNIRFYVLALVFIIFEVEVVFLFPWALVYRSLGLFGFIEMAIFLVILLIGLAYVWVKGDLGWDKPRPEIPRVPRRTLNP